MRRAARVDANHAEIIDTLRKCGWTVYDTSALGNGFFDCIAWKGERGLFVEIKDGSLSPSRRRLTPDEQRVHAAFKANGAPVVILESVEQAAQL